LDGLRDRREGVDLRNGRTERHRGRCCRNPGGNRTQNELPPIREARV
jgi:hypothetical protein